MIAARRSVLAGVVSLCSLVATVEFSANPAQAAQGHAFSKTIGEPCPSEPCEGAKLKEPDGVAVNLGEGAATSGDVYVVDRGANRVVRFGPEGVFQSEFKGPSATGSGTLTGGSSTITEALATAGAFTVGEEVAGAGIPAGTKITAVPGGGVLELENPVEGSGSTLAVELKASQSFEHPTLVAVDSLTGGEDPSAGDVYVVDAGHDAVDKYTAEGEFVTQFTGFGPGRPFVGTVPGIGVAVDATGRLWIAGRYNEISRGVGVFDNALFNTLSEIFFELHIKGELDQGFALDSTGAFYVHEGFFTEDTIDKFVGGSGGGEVEPVRELLLPVAPGGLAVEPGGAGDLYVSVGGVVERFAGGSGVLVEKFGSEHLTDARGVAVNAADTVFVSDGTSGVVDVFPLEQPSAPSVESLGVSDVSGDSVTLEAALNARGAQASYSLQFGRCVSLAACASAGYEPAAAGTLPADFKVHGVSVHLQGLVPGSAYHFRVLVSNAFGSAAPVQERTFTTQSVAAGGLLDARRWEMVSPPEKHGALVESIGEFRVTQASVDGRAFTFLTDAPTETQPSGSADLIQVLAGRGTTGWSTSDLAPPHATPTGIAGGGQEFRWFSEDLGVGVVQPFGGFTPSLSPAASEQTAFLRSDYLAGDPTRPCVQGAGSVCYTPLVSGCPAAGTPCAAAVAEHANVPAGTIFGEQTHCPPQGTQQECGPRFVGASPDGSHVVLTSKVALTEGALPGSLYESSAGHLALASVLPNGEPSGLLPVLGLLGRSARGAVSRDGSRIVWSQFGGGHLFLRDMLRGETVQLDAIQGGSGLGEPRPLFQFASSDGSRVYFTDEQPLTADSGGSLGSNHDTSDLYECEMVLKPLEGKERLTCVLHDLTPLAEGKPAEVRGEVLGASDDGSTLYFVANGVLATGAEPGNCSGVNSPAGAACSLYAWHDGVTSFIARLSAEDYPDWSDRSSVSPLRGMTSRVSADGRWLVFMSDAGLSGFDTHDAASGKPVEEVYLFDRSRAVSAAGAGAAANPVCVSCDPSGGRPTGVEYRFIQAEGTDGTIQQWDPSRLIGGSVPGWTSYAEAALYQPRFLSDTGRVFFNTPEALLAGDVNGAGDVYEFEPQGVPAGEHACSESTSGFSARSGGCLGLISSGEETGESGFLDASASGSDVFFFTDGKLSKADFDHSRDVYDAHECTTTAPCLPQPAASPPPCTTETSCKAAPTGQPTIFSSPASATFNGPGNQTPPPPPKGKTAAQIRAERLTKALKACRRKHNRNKRALCERQAHKKYGAVKAKKSTRAKRASNNRRAK